MIYHKNDTEAMLFIKPNWDKGPWVAGGAPLAWYNGEQVTTDFDVYFKNEQDFEKFYDTFKEEEISSLDSVFSHFKRKNDDVRIVHKSDNAITIRYKEKYTIQFIRHTFYDSPLDIIDNFDISVCQLVTDGNKLIFGEHTLRDIKSKTLRIVNYRAGCVSRYVKYLAYGYKPIKGTLENIINIPNLNDTFKPGYEEYDY